MYIVFIQHYVNVCCETCLYYLYNIMLMCVVKHVYSIYTTLC